jgi:hypothetical protein
MEAYSLLSCVRPSGIHQRRVPRHPPVGTKPRLPSRRLSERKPVTSAITSLRDDERTERRHGYQKKTFLPLDTAQKPYYCGCKYPHVRAVSVRRPCLALHRRALPVTRASAANHRRSISVCRRDDSVIANINVTSKATDYACPQHACAPRGRRRRAETTA